MTSTMEVSMLGVSVMTSQRLSLGRGSGKAFHTATHRHLPGAVLRGALAKAWIAHRGAPDADFRRVFDGELRFGPLFAEGSAVQPLSVRVCKYGPGHCTPWYHDAAFPAGGSAPPAGWDGVSGHWTRSRGDVVGPGGVAVPTTAVSSTAIDPARHTASDGRLFSRDSLCPGLTFTGAVAGGEEALALLAGVLPELERLELGGRTSVLGSGRITQTGSSAPARPDPGADLVVLRLTSPAFLVDAAGRPSLDLAGELSQRHGVGGEVQVWARSLTDGTGGFHAASRLPKPVEVGLAAGTTVAVRARDEDAAVLAGLVASGIGLRRPEGFGWVELATGPWQPAAARPALAAAQAAVEEPSVFAALLAQVRDVRLSGEVRQWFLARLRDVGMPAGLPPAEAMDQPGALELSWQQREVVGGILTDQTAAVRRQLADALQQEEHR